MIEARVFRGADALAGAVAEALIQRLAEIQAQERTPTIALTGGGIARKVHQTVTTSVSALDVDWSQINFWFGDERYVDAWSDERNAGQARRDLLDQLAVDPARVHEMPAADSGLTLDEAAAAYADQVRVDGAEAFDVVMLGIGPDGHVASLFPGHPALDVVDRIAVAVPDAPKPPAERISLTYAALNRSRAVWFLAAGDEKAEAVLQALTPGDVHEIPARGVSAPETIWWLDTAAASRLPR